VSVLFYARNGLKPKSERFAKAPQDHISFRRTNRCRTNSWLQTIEEYEESNLSDWSIWGLVRRWRSSTSALCCYHQYVASGRPQKNRGDHGGNSQICVQSCPGWAPGNLVGVWRCALPGPRAGSEINGPRKVNAGWNRTLSTDTGWIGFPGIVGRG
jgi:hypothetical protein